MPSRSLLSRDGFRPRPGLRRRSVGKGGSKMERAMVSKETGRSIPAIQGWQPGSSAVGNTAILRPPQPSRVPTAIANAAITQVRTLHGVGAGSAAQETEPSTDRLRAATQGIAGLSIALMMVGLIVGFIYPGPITGALLPIGLLLWVLVGVYARRFDSSATS